MEIAKQVERNIEYIKLLIQERDLMLEYVKSSDPNKRDEINISLDEIRVKKELHKLEAEIEMKENYNKTLLKYLDSEKKL